MIAVVAVLALLEARHCDVALESGGSGLVTVEEWAIATRLGGDSERTTD